MKFQAKSRKRDHAMCCGHESQALPRTEEASVLLSFFPPQYQSKDSGQCWLYCWGNIVSRNEC